MLIAVFSTSVLLLIIFVPVNTITGPQIRDRTWYGYKKFQHNSDTSYQRSAAKIIHMMREVILDMQRKIEAHYIISQKWRNHRRFQIAQIVFDTRKKASMIRNIIKQNLVWDNLKNEYIMKNRTDHHKKDFLAVKDMSRCQFESIEIDKLVHIVEKYQWSRLNSTNIEIKYKYVLRTNNETENENKKSILREHMKNIKNKHEDGLNTLVEKLEDIPEQNLKELLKKIGDVPQKRAKNIGVLRNEGFKQIRKMAESNKNTSDDPKHPGDGFDEDDDEAWK